MNFVDRLKKISDAKAAISETSFLEYIDLFTDDSIKEERLSYYEEYKSKMGSESLAQAKHEIIKNIFGSYSKRVLETANHFAYHRENEEASRLVFHLEKLRDVFKNHDVVNFKDFILSSEEEITETELDLLFLKPVLNNHDLQKLTDAFIKALGKKNNISSIDEFQQKFFSHPLIDCLDANKDLARIKDSVESGSLELAKYEKLVQVMLEVRDEVNAEEYQGFITFLIKEDLTKGFANIIKSVGYEPKEFKRLLSEISKGNQLSSESVSELILEIRKNHTKSLKLDGTTLLETNNSNQALNDYGFPVKSGELNVFFHGHATENHGEKQAQQQINTGINLELSEKYDENIGLTVTKVSALKTNHHKDFLVKEKLVHNLDATKTEEIMISNLLFDASYFTYLSTKIHNSKKENKTPISVLKEGRLLSNNHLIVKEDISRSQKIILNNIGKNDFELLCEKKNAYMNFFKKNEDFMKDLLAVGSTNNYLAYELIGSPTLKCFNSLLTIEKKAKIKLFNDDDISVIADLSAASKRNNELSYLSAQNEDLIEDRESLSLENIDVESFSSLAFLCGSDEQKEINQNKEIKFLTAEKVKKPHLSDALYMIDKNQEDLFSDKKYSKRIAKALMTNIKDSLDCLLKYRSDKVDNFSYYISSVGEQLLSGKNIEFAPSDWSQSHYHGEYKTLASLFKEAGKNHEQISNDRLILAGLLKVAELSGSKLTCKNVSDLESSIKIKSKKM